jgi:hypothetical protein
MLPLAFHASRAALCSAAALLLFLPARAPGETQTIGQIAPPGSSTSCIDCSSFTYSTNPASPSYAVPAGNWTVISWSTQGGTTGGPVSLQAYRPTGVTDQWRLIAVSAEQTIAANTAPAIATSLPVQGGDVLGMRATNVPRVYAGNPGDQIGNVIGDPAVGQTTGSGGDFEFAFAGGLLNMAATLLRDTTAPDTTAPETTITKEPKNKTEKSKVRYRFESNEPGSSFQCAFDNQVKRHHFVDCRSPKKYKGVDDGKHKFLVRATDAAGNFDPTPAKDRFKKVG